LVFLPSLILIGELRIDSINGFGLPASLEGKANKNSSSHSQSLFDSVCAERRGCSQTVHCQYVGEREIERKRMNQCVSVHCAMKYDFTSRKNKNAWEKLSIADGVNHSV
jgi:hypothetical protein